MLQTSRILSLSHLHLKGLKWFRPVLLSNHGVVFQEDEELLCFFLAKARAVPMAVATLVPKDVLQCSPNPLVPTMCRVELHRDIADGIFLIRVIRGELNKMIRAMALTDYVVYRYRFRIHDQDPTLISNATEKSSVSSNSLFS